MRTLTPPGQSNGRVAAPPIRPVQRVRPISGRRALGLVVLLMVLFGLVVGAVVVGRTWRQSERLVAAGLRSPRGVALMPDDGLVVAEAGVPDAAGPRDPSTRPI